MKDIQAFVVGIARYGLPWDADSAAQNAYAIVRLLVSAGIPANRIQAFIDNEGLSSSQREKLSRRGVLIRPTTSIEIDTFWRVELPKLLKKNDKLFVYWSGHGVTDDKEQRLFYCSDYSEAANNRLFNANEFLDHLKTNDYAQCREQMFFADVCGTYAGTPVNPTRRQLHSSKMREIDQLTVYASPDGVYANSKNYGAFTSLLVDALREFRTVWPTSQAFLEKLAPIADAWGQKPFWIQWRGNQQMVGEHLVGRTSGYCRATEKLLSPHRIPPETLKRAYEKTVRNLRAQPLLLSHGLLRLVDALVSIEDDGNSGAPSALLQFLIRLSSDKKVKLKCRKAIKAWINDNSTELSLAEIIEKMAGERPMVHLIIDVSNDQNGDPTQAIGELLDDDGWPVAGFHQQVILVKTDVELLDWIAALVERALEIDETARPEIHIFVDPPLLHLPFHQATLRRNLLELGGQFDCILHYRSRAQQKVITQPENWAAWAASLRGHLPANTELQELALAPAPFPDRTGICFAGFAHGPMTKSVPQIQRLTLLLMRGAPYVCWSLKQHPTLAMKEALKALIGSAGSFEQVPEQFRHKRLDGDEVANELSFIWDDPSRRLLPQSLGVIG